MIERPKLADVPATVEGRRLGRARCRPRRRRRPDHPLINMRAATGTLSRVPPLAWTEESLCRDLARRWR